MPTARMKEANSPADRVPLMTFMPPYHRMKAAEIPAMSSIIGLETALTATRFIQLR